MAPNQEDLSVPTDVRLSASKQRARAAGSAGLSELSKQLRMLHAKNEAQAVEINRLERQLRILAELQGISVADLRRALDDACANEAFGEMQHRVAKLRAELEAATLAKQAELRKDGAAPHIANLELRLGELEEVEERQQAEIYQLYEQLRQERERSTRLEGEAEQNKKDMQDYLDRLKRETDRAARLESGFQEQMQNLQAESEKRLQERLRNQSSAISDEERAKQEQEHQRLLRLLQEKEAMLRENEARLKAEQEAWAQRAKDSDAQALNAQMNEKMDKEKMNLTIQQLQDADSQNELRLAQFKARFAMQDGRINDMGQQLESLYTAFGIIKEDQDAEELKRAALRSSLDEADAQVARQFENSEKGKGHQNLKSKGTNFLGNSDIPRMISTPSTALSSPGQDSRAFTPTANATPISGTPPRGSRSAQRTPTTWQLLFPDQQSPSRDALPTGASTDIPDTLMSGLLLVKSKSVMRKWKQKQAKLYLTGNHYTLDLGEGKSFLIGFGISKVEFNPNHSLSFLLYTNPYDEFAPVVEGAAVTESDYHRWMAALTRVTTGVEQGQAAQTLPLDNHSRRSGVDSVSGSCAISARVGGEVAQENDDLQRALEISKHQV